MNCGNFKLVNWVVIIEEKVKYVVNNVMVLMVELVVIKWIWFFFLKVLLLYWLLVVLMCLDDIFLLCFKLFIKWWVIGLLIKLFVIKLKVVDVIVIFIMFCKLYLFVNILV